MRTIRKLLELIMIPVLAFMALPVLPVGAVGGEVTGANILITEPVAGALPTKTADLVLYTDGLGPVEIKNVGIEWDVISEDGDRGMAEGEVFEDGMRYWFYWTTDGERLIQEKMDEFGLMMSSDDMESLINGKLIALPVRPDFLVGERVEAMDFIVEWPVIGKAFPTDGKVALTIGGAVQKFEVSEIEWRKILEDGNTEAVGAVAEADVAYTMSINSDQVAEMEELLETKIDVRTSIYYNGMPFTMEGGIYAVEPENKEALTTEINGKGEFWLDYTDPATGEVFWVGLDNSEEVFEDGSTFWMNVVEGETGLYERYYAQIDNGIKERIDSEKAVMFVAGVTKADGTEYEMLDKSIELYVQMGEDWDAENTEAIFIGLEDDEELKIGFEEKMVPSDHDFRFAKLEISHFSPYMIYQTKAAAGTTVPETFDGIQGTIVMAEVSLVVLFGTGVVFAETRRNRSQK